LSRFMSSTAEGNSVMNNPAIDYLTDSDGNPKAVVIPIELWRR